VVLDMDECLIHSQFPDQLADKYRQVEDRPTSSSTHHCESFGINLPDGDFVKVNKRPHLEIFLQEITSKYETHIFTAAMEVYASPILNHIEPKARFAGRLYREHCSYHPELRVFAKDLCNIRQMRQTMTNNDSLVDEEIACSANDDLLPCDQRRIVLVSGHD